MLKRAIVIGASSGIGAALVEVLVAQGFQVAAVARREKELNEMATSHNRVDHRVFVFTHDVTETPRVPSVFEQAVEALGGLDLVVYAAGVMPAVGPSEWSTEKDHEIMAVNTLGAIAWLNLAAARFELQRSGTLAAIGSVAGDRGRRGQPAYCASKAALHCYLESLRNRLSQHGVRVVTLKPGPVHTPMTEGLEKMPMAISAKAAADSCWRAIRRGSAEAYMPRQWGPIMTVIRSIPSLIFRRLDL
jgi:decaprenylphospho-beta-D-erythro-pentofuranosid-2-ulose 2-reductase